MAVAVEFILTLPIAGVTHAEAIQQIMVRASPHLLDLMAALALILIPLSPYQL